MATLFSEVNSKPRQDWHLTSSGVGHQYRPGIDFYDSKDQTIHEPLPLSLVKPNQVIPSMMYTTTTGSIHDKKFIQRQLTHPVFEKGPNLRQCHYVKDLMEKLGPGSWRQPLSMGYQKTETQDEFDAKEGIKDHYLFDDISIKGQFLPNDGLQASSTKHGTASTINPKLKSRIVDLSDMGIFDVNEPYLTTNQVYHRRFKPREKELSKNAAVNKELFHSPVAKTLQPMRDTTRFKFRTVIPRLPKTIKHVPHKGQLTEYQEIYQRPSDVKYTQDVYCPEDTPWTLPKPSAESITTVPRFYTTEYQTIGKKESVPI